MSHYKMYMIQSTVYLIAPSFFSYYSQKIRNTSNGKRGERAVFFSIQTVGQVFSVIVLSVFIKKN